MRFVFDVRPDNGPRSRWEKTARRISIGRAPACDLVLTSELVSGQHAAIEARGAGAVLCDLNSTNGTYLNGKRVDAPSVLRVGDAVMLGHGGPVLQAIAIEPDSPAAAVAAAPPSTLQIARPGGGNKSRTVRIGRAPDNDLVLDDPSVSSYHAKLLVDRPGHGVLEDLGSTNGIALGSPDNHVARAEIAGGDRVFFGAISMPAEALLGPSQSAAVGSKSPRGPAFPLVASGIVAGVVAVAACLVFAVLLWRAEKTPAAAAATKEPAPAPAPRSDKAAAPVSLVSVRVGDPKAVAEAQPAPAPAPAPAPDLDKVAERATQAVVWIGISHKDYLIPYASAWAVKPDVLVTTAAAVTALEKLASNDDMQIVAWSNEATIPVKSFQTDPRYSRSNPASDISLRSNIGTVRLATPIARTVEVAPQERVRSIGPSTPLVVVGYYSWLKPVDPYDRLKVRLEHAPLALRSTEDDRPGFAPLFVVDVPAKGQPGGRWFDGAPVQCGDGTVVGLLSTGSSRNRMIPIDTTFWNAP